MLRDPLAGPILEPGSRCIDTREPRPQGEALEEIAEDEDEDADGDTVMELPPPQEPQDAHEPESAPTPPATPAPTRTHSAAFPDGTR